LRNDGGQSINEVSASARLSDSGQALETVTGHGIAAGGNLNLEFPLPQDFVPGENERMELIVRKTRYPIHEWRFSAIPVGASESKKWLWLGVGGGTIALLLLLWLLKRRRQTPPAERTAVITENE